MPGDSASRLENGVFYPSIAPEAATAGQRERCVIDLQYPTDRSGFATVVWFHGGGFTGGSRFFPEGLADRGYAVAAAGYRLHPDVSCPTYLEDAAQALAWVFHHIDRFGGDPDRIVVSGRSAGAYLATMLGLDRRWLAAHGLDANRLAGIIPVSGQMTTHFHLRAERGDTAARPLVDELAPLWHARGDAAPVLLITGDRDMDIPARVEENLLFHRHMAIAGHPDVTMHEIKGAGHMNTREAMPLMLDWLDRRFGPERP